MASGLAAAIEKTFGMSARLKEGHHGIYEVTLEGRVLFTNQGRCGSLPMNEEILREILKHRDPLPGESVPKIEIFPMFRPGP